MRRCVAVILLVGAAMAASPAVSSANRPPLHGYEASWPYPLTPGTPLNPVLTLYDITDCPAGLVADPFLVHREGIWYMFFEIYAWPGVIGVATSVDGYDWVYDRVVLREDHHISYPHVFGYDDGSGEQYYMVVESGATQSVPLYKSAAFPYQWNQVAVLASGREFADPTVFRWNGTWWMFVSPAYGDRCFLYYSDNLQSGWVEHPLSPIAWGRSMSRPAGRVMVVGGNRLIRLAQKSDVVYGQAVRAFEVDVLTRTAYAEHEIPDSPILTASGQGWNAEGMHQCDEQWTGSSWLAAVDGFAAGRWSIGIYSRFPDPADVAPQVSAPRPRWAYPNPVRAGQEVRLVLDGGDAIRPEDLAITDVAGRAVPEASTGRRIVRAGADGSSLSISWVTRDGAGRALSPGVYFVRTATERPGVLPPIRIVVTR
jgi:hypothetical protein